MSKSTTESQLAKILGTLGNKDAIKILRFAKNGFDSSTNMHEELGLSVKRYYYRLERLIGAGLVTKVNNRYELTPLGAIFADSTERGRWGIENIHKLTVMENVRRSKNIGEETWQSVLADLFGDEFVGTKSGTTVRTITTYDDLVDSIIRLMDTATESIYIATRYLDVRVMEAAWRSIIRGGKIRSIDSTDSALSSMKILQTLIRHPKYAKLVYDLWHSEKVKIRYREIPFSFMVVDERDCCFEVLNPTVKGFFTAVELHNSKTICPKLIETFENLWKEGEKNDTIAELTETLLEGREND